MLQVWAKWLVNDWKYNRFRLICETLGSLAFILIYLLMAWYGDDVCITTIFIIQLIGSSLHIINAYMRSSVNLIMLNSIVILIALFGLGKMHLWGKGEWGASILW